MSETKYPPLFLRLVNTSESNWIMEGTQKDPVRLAWPSLYRISPTSKMRVDLPESEGGGYKYVQTRYIAGCDYIDPVRQEKEGYKPNIEQDNIWISQGTLTVLREGSTIGLYDYLKVYQGNIDNKFRPADADPEFEELKQVEIAKKKVAGFQKISEAYAVLREVSQPTTDGSGEYNFDTEKLQQLVAYFDLSHLDTNEDKMNELYRIANATPEKILDVFVNARKKLYAQIKIADELNVIGFADDKVYLQSTGATILPFKGKVARQNQINKLADHLLTEEGNTWFVQINHAVESAKRKALEPVR